MSTTDNFHDRASGFKNKQSSKTMPRLKYATEKIVSQIDDELNRKSGIRIQLYEKKDQTGSKTEQVYLSYGGVEYPIDLTDYTQFIKYLQARDDIGYTLYLDEHQATLDIYRPKKKVLEVKEDKRGNNKRMFLGIVGKEDGLNKLEEINNHIIQTLGHKIGQIPKEHKKVGDGEILYIDLKDLK